MPHQQPKARLLPLGEGLILLLAPQSTTIAELSKFTCKFAYRVTRMDENRPRPTLLVKGYTIHAAVTRQGKLTRLPEEIMDRLRGIVSGRIVPGL